ncbi:MAG: hypothetical protein RIM99_07490 [Cyclobacteriaceae bacterium]
MKKFLFLFVFVSGVAFSQDADSLLIDSLLVEIPPEHTIGLFIQAGTSLSPNPDTYEFLTNYGLGIVYDRFQIIFLASFYEGELNRRLIFPNNFSLDYQLGGGFVSYSILNPGKVEVAPFIALQFGDMVWERSDTREDFLREKFNLVQMGVSIRYHLNRFVKIELLSGYQKMSDFDLAGLKESDFRGYFAGFNVKVGYFNQ